MSGRFYILAASKPDLSVAEYDARRLGVAVATAEQVDLLGPLSVGELLAHGRKHGATPDQLRRYADGECLWALVLKVRALKQPRRYKMRPGAVTIIRDVKFI